MEGDDEQARLRRDFEDFHAENPHVYTELVRLARLGRAKGLARWGIGRLFEVMRWNHALCTEGDTFKLNNNLRAFYSRMLMEQEPDLAGFFETRASVADV